MNTNNEVNTTTQNAQEGNWVPISAIIVPTDARIHTPEDVDSRAQSMAKDGQLQNILLSKEGDKLVLVYGHGRLLSAQKLGWEKIRADVKEGLTESQKLLMTLAENEERAEAGPIYTAYLYKRIMAVEGLSAEHLPDRLGKSRATVYQYLALANLPSEVVAMSTRVDIGLKHWLEIAKLQKPEEQIQLAQECAEKDYSVQELQARVKQLLNPKAELAKPQKPAGPAFQFKWKGRELQIKVRPFQPDKEHWSDYTIALDDAANKYRAAFPLPELSQAHQEVKQAA